MIELGTPSQLLKEIPAVHPWHQEINENQAQLLDARKLRKRLLAVLRRGHGVTVEFQRLI